MDNWLRDTLKDLDMNHEERAGILMIANTNEYKEYRNKVKSNPASFEGWTEPYILSFLIFCTGENDKYTSVIDKNRFREKAKEIGIKLRE